MDVTIARYVESRVQRQRTSSRPGTKRTRADCLRSGQIGMGFWEARYLFIEKSIPYHRAALFPLPNLLFSGNASHLIV